MIDTRQQSLVVRELSRLANTTHAAETQVGGWVGGWVVGFRWKGVALSFTTHPPTHPPTHPLIHRPSASWTS